MDEEKPSPEEERQLLNLFEQAALRDFPNPDRIGCPGSGFLRKMATHRKAISVRDPRLRHVARCSPCFQEFSAFRSKAVARRKRNRLSLIAAGIVVIAMSVVGVVERARLSPIFVTGTRSGGQTYVAATLDLKDRSIIRGAEERPPAAATNSLKLPHRKVDLTITLPFASPAGWYEVQLLREIGNPLRSASGDARIEKGLTLLTVKLDLFELTPGQYLVGIRRVPWDWTFHPVTIE